MSAYSICVCVCVHVWVHVCVSLLVFVTFSVHIIYKCVTCYIVLLFYGTSTHLKCNDKMSTTCQVTTHVMLAHLPSVRCQRT